MRKTLGVALAVILSSSLSAMGHPNVQLLDQFGNPVTKSGLPVDTRESCGACHNIDFIASAFHFQEGRLTLLSPDVYKKYYENYGNNSIENGLPESLNPATNQGMYGVRIDHNPHYVFLAPKEVPASKMGTIDWTTPEYDLDCVKCHPGGGPFEKDRDDNFLWKKTKEDIENEIKSGTIPTDYVTVEWKDGKLVAEPFTWRLQAVNAMDNSTVTIHNTMQPTCFLCHSNLLTKDWDTQSNGSMLFRAAATGMLTKGKPYFAAADALGGLIATGVNATTLDLKYNPNVFADESTATINGTAVIGKATDMHCAHCHGAREFDDVGGAVNGTADPLDFWLQLPDAKFLQPDTFKSAWVWNFTGHKDGNGNWVKASGSTDVHRLKGVTCVECHEPVSHEPLGGSFAPKFTIPSHDFAFGDAGFSVRRDQLAGTLTCQTCHTDPEAIHSGVFGPGGAAAVHMEKVACTTCHIGKKYFYRNNFLDYGTPMFVINGKCVNGTVSVKTLMPHFYVSGDPQNGTYEDIVWYPEKQPDGTIKWKLKPANAFGVLSFESNATGQFMPIPYRDYLRALGVDPNLPTMYMKVEIDPNSHKPKRVPHTVTLFDGTNSTLHTLHMVPAAGKIAADPDVGPNGNYIVLGAIPNYIDVNLDGKYDTGDVQITDDTGIEGSKDGVPEINTKEEVTAAIQTVEKIVRQGTGNQNVVVKLAALPDFYMMAHNIRPASEALSCDACHGGTSTLSGKLFTRTLHLYYPLDPDVTGNSTLFRNPYNISNTMSAGDYATTIQKMLTDAGYAGTTSTGNATTSTGNATTGGTSSTTGGGGGGGCSIAPAAGFGASLSYLLGLLPLGFLRRRREDNDN